MEVLKRVCDKTVSFACVCELHKRFFDNWGDMYNYLKSNQSWTTNTFENIEKVRNVVCSDHCLTISVTSEVLNIKVE